MPKGLRRRYGQRQLHFITCSCYRHFPLFASVRSKNLFVKILGEVRRVAQPFFFLLIVPRNRLIPLS